MIASCGSQLRLITIPTADGIVTRPIGLDYTPVMIVGAARGADLAMLAELLPDIEAAILVAGAGDAPDVDIVDEPT